MIHNVELMMHNTNDTICSRWYPKDDIHVPKKLNSIIHFLTLIIDTKWLQGTWRNDYNFRIQRFRDMFYFVFN